MNFLRQLFRIKRKLPTAEKLGRPNHESVTATGLSRNLIKAISLIAFCSVLLSFNASSLFNVYAQQSGAATSGNAIGGSAIGGSAPCYGTCNYYGGPANIGPATSGSANSKAGVDFVPVKVQPGGPMKNGGPCTMTFTT